jgi:hypothetical protein
LFYGQGLSAPFRSFAEFAGPMLLSTSNLGPLLGIFVTGPLGFLLEGLVGALPVSNRSARLASIVISVVWAFGSRLCVLGGTAAGVDD